MGEPSEPVWAGGIDLRIDIALRFSSSTISSSIFNMKRCFVGVNPVLVVRCLCCNTAHTDASHARIYHQEGTQQLAEQHILIHTASRLLKSLSVTHRMKGGIPLFPGRDLRLDIAFPAGECSGVSLHLTVQTPFPCPRLGAR